MKFTVTMKRNHEFQRLYHKGKSAASPYLALYCRKSKRGQNRLGFTVGKKVGCAVERNRCRRIIREAYRLLEPGLTPGWDIVFVARTRTKGCSMNQIHQVMEGHLRQLTTPPVKKR